MGTEGLEGDCEVELEGSWMEGQKKMGSALEGGQTGLERVGWELERCLAAGLERTQVGVGRKLGDGLKELRE